MSTLVVATIKNSGSGAPTIQNSSGTEIGQVAKAWCRWHTSGTTAIDDSFGVNLLQFL